LLRRRGFGTLDLPLLLNHLSAAVFSKTKVVFNPDAAVGSDSKRQAQSFRSEDDGLLPLSIHRSALH
jgi:hypothetical protein